MLLVPIFLLVFCGASIHGSTISSRLPSSVRPQHYKLKIRTNLPQSFNVDGKVWIQVQCLTPTENITLHVRDLNINQAGLTVMDISDQKQPQTLKVRTVEVQKELDFFVIHLERQLVPNRSYGVYIPWKSEIKDALDGFYRSGYDDKATGKKKWIGVTHFEPDGARKTFPCFDEPAMKATFDIIIGRSEGFSVASNMPLAQSEPIKGEQGWFWDKFERSVPMSTYLVAWMVSDFGYVTSPPLKAHQNSNFTYNSPHATSPSATSSPSTPTTFRIWARRDALSQAQFASEVGPVVLDFFERYFQIHYPLPKQDLVALPDFVAGAMENWGMITFRETSLLFDSKQSSFSNKKSIASVVAHELAHQWFGNLVTMEWWNDLWLNEGFATFMASLALDKLYPEWHTFNSEVYDQLQNVFAMDVLVSSHPISANVDNARDIMERFDNITYLKGSLLIRMLYYILGEEGLRQSIVAYLSSHMYKNAKQEDFFRALSLNAQKNGKIPEHLTIEMIMDSWTLQTGFPIITVTRNYEQNAAEITQKRYNPQAVQKPPSTASSSEPCWVIPLSYTSRSRLVQRKQRQTALAAAVPESATDTAEMTDWMECPKKTKTIQKPAAGPNDWLLFNVNSAAIMRVNYDARNWQLLSQALENEPETIPIMNRAALIEDSFDFAWYGYLNYSVPFDLIHRYLPRETEYLPWSTALSKLSALDGQLDKVSFYGDFEAYLRKLLTPVYEHTGGFDRAKLMAMLRYDAESYQRRVVSMACRAGVELCVEEARALYEAYRDNTDEDTNPIPASMRTIVLRQAIRMGGLKEWDFLWSRYHKSNVFAEKYSILLALGATKEYWLLRRYLEWSLKPETGIRRQDAPTVFQVVSNSQLGYYAAKEFLLQNVKQISEYLKSNRIGNYVRAIFEGVTTDIEYEEMAQWAAKNAHYLANGKAVVARSLEQAQSRIKWHKEHLRDIAETLKRYKNK